MHSPRSRVLPPSSSSRDLSRSSVAAALGPDAERCLPINLPSDAPWLPLSRGPVPEPPVFWLGAYGELRPGVYERPLFQNTGGPSRTVHIGLDLGAPAGTPVFAPCAGEIFLQGINPADGDYGGVLITRHQRGEGLRMRSFYLLFGHLAHQSIKLRTPGEPVAAGTLLGWLGTERENGGWAPHLHLQVSEFAPKTHDLPGVVTVASFPTLRRRFPDPERFLRLSLPPH